LKSDADCNDKSRAERVSVHMRWLAPPLYKIKKAGASSRL
jgi:hypothetical protein